MMDKPFKNLPWLKAGRMSDRPVNILSELKNKLVVKDRIGGYENLLVTISHRKESA